MNTAWDWGTLILFAGLTMLFLQRSTGPARAGDHPIRYLPPALGCALANWLGNEGQIGTALCVAVLVIAYILAVLRPWPLDRNRTREER